LSSDETTTAEGVDLDEDLFNFDEVAGGDVFDDEDDTDLDEIFATFQAEDDDETEIGVEPPPPAEPAAADPPAPEPSTPPLMSEPVAATATAPAPAAASAAPAPAAPVPVAPVAGAISVGVPRTMIWLFVALTSVNALLAIVTLSIAGSMSSGVQEMTSEVSNSVDSFVTKAVNELDAYQGQAAPVTPTDPANHEAFETAETMIAEARYGDARRVLYALLAVVDRMDPVQRRAVEARANYLIADAYQREAHERIGGRR
jgi:hypothetical protein